VFLDLTSSQEPIFNPETDVETADMPFELFTAGSQAVITFKLPGTQDRTFNQGIITGQEKK